MKIYIFPLIKVIGTEMEANTFRSSYLADSIKKLFQDDGFGFSEMSLLPTSICKLQCNL